MITPYRRAEAPYRPSAAPIPEQRMRGGVPPLLDLHGAEVGQTPAAPLGRALTGAIPAPPRRPPESRRRLPPSGDRQQPDTLFGELAAPPRHAGEPSRQAL